MFFLQSLLCVIVNNFDTIILEFFEDSNRNLSELADNICGILFSQLAGKIPDYQNKAIMVVVILCMICFSYKNQSSLFQVVNCNNLIT